MIQPPCANDVRHGPSTLIVEGRYFCSACGRTQYAQERRPSLRLVGAAPGGRRS